MENATTWRALRFSTAITSKTTKPTVDRIAPARCVRPLTGSRNEKRMKQFSSARRLGATASFREIETSSEATALPNPLMVGVSFSDFSGTPRDQYQGSVVAAESAIEKNLPNAQRARATASE